MSEDIPVQRGRGRPPGALNKKTIEKQREMEEATTLDVSFEEPEEVGEVEEPVIEAEELEEPEPEPPRAKAKAKRKPRKAPSPPPPTDEDDEETVVPEYQSASSDADTEPEVVPEPLPKKKARAKPRPKPPREPEQPLTYLQVLQRGLLAAKATHKAEKVAKYDQYFANL